jgi:hypothetical protein
MARIVTSLLLLLAVTQIALPGVSGVPAGPCPFAGTDSPERGCCAQGRGAAQSLREANRTRTPAAETPHCALCSVLRHEHPRVADATHGAALLLKWTAVASHPQDGFVSPPRPGASASSAPARSRALADLPTIRLRC